MLIVRGNASATNSSEMPTAGNPLDEIQCTDLQSTDLHSTDANDIGITLIREGTQAMSGIWLGPTKRCKPDIKRFMSV